MPTKHSRHVALTGPLADWAEQEVAKGEYTSLSDLIRTAIRFLQERDEQKRDRDAALLDQAAIQPRG